MIIKCRRNVDKCTTIPIRQLIVQRKKKETCFFSSLLIFFNPRLILNGGQIKNTHMSYNHLCGDYNSGSNSYRKYKIFDDGFNIETKIRNNIGIPVIHVSISNRNSKQKRKSRERCKLFKKEFRLIDLPMFTRTIYTVSCNNDID